VRSAPITHCSPSAAATGRSIFGRRRGRGLARRTDLGISTLDDVLTDVRRITDARPLPLLVDVDTASARCVQHRARRWSLIKLGAAAMHIEDQAGASKLRAPSRQGTGAQEMVDRVKAAVDARTDPPAGDGAYRCARRRGLDAAIDHACACAEAGADMISRSRHRAAKGQQFAAEVGVPVLA
jgi:methylisocitrate lyase